MAVLAPGGGPQLAVPGKEPSVFDVVEVDVCLGRECPLSPIKDRRTANGVIPAFRKQDIVAHVFKAVGVRGRENVAYFIRQPIGRGPGTRPDVPEVSQRLLSRRRFRELVRERRVLPLFTQPFVEAIQGGDPASERAA